MPVKLESDATEVRIQKQAPAIADYESLGEVFCEFGANFVVVTNNVRACRNDLKNQAHRLGATLVVVETEILGTSGCGNCVSMFGTAYKEKIDVWRDDQRNNEADEGPDNRPRTSEDWDD